MVYFNHIKKYSNMSMQSNFAIIRKDDRLTLTDADRQTIKEALESYQKNFEYAVERSKSLSEEYKGLGRMVAPTEPDIPEFIYLDSTHWYNTIDKSIWVNIFDEYFSSTFGELLDYWNIPYDGKAGQYFVSKEEAKEINVAAKYLANGKYDKDFESLLDSRFIEILSDLMPKYGKRGANKDGLCLFVDKEDDGSYKITDRRWEWGDCEDETESEGKYILENLSYVMGLYLKELSESVDYNGKILREVRLMYRRT